MVWSQPLHLGHIDFSDMRDYLYPFQDCFNNVFMDFITVSYNKDFLISYFYSVFIHHNHPNFLHFTIVTYIFANETFLLILILLF